MKTSAADLIEQLRARSSKDPFEVVEKRMVPAETVIGTSTSDIRALAKTTTKDRSLAEGVMVFAICRGEGFSDFIVTTQTHR